MVHVGGEGAVNVADAPPVPAVVAGVVRHRRRGQVNHAFSHRADQWLVDTADLPGHGPLAGFRAPDHIGDPHASIDANIRGFLTRNGESAAARGRILMLANARLFGYVFDPITVFWCFDRGGELAAVVCEVHNTYGQRHAYLLHPDHSGRATTAKKLYVSPFYEVDGSYELTFRLAADRIAVAVVRRSPDPGEEFSASFSGRPVPATRRVAVRSALSAMTLRVPVLIRLHGVWLWLRRLPIVPRPTEGGRR